VKLVLADDDPHCRSAIHLLLDDEPGVQMVADCSTGDELIQAIQRREPDVALVDWELPGLRITDIPPTCRVVAMSGRPDRRQKALRAGAVRFVCKCDGPGALLAVVRELIGVAVE
jgi:two-component system response regulator DesR